MPQKKTLLFISLVLIILTSILTVSAAEQNYALVEDMTSDFTLGSTIHIEESTTDSFVKKVSAEVSFYPRNDVRQQGSFLTLEPDAANINDNVKFIWENIKNNELSFKLVNRVKTENELVKVKTKVNFPYSKVPEDAQKYLQETQLMDYNNLDIKTMASKLAEGEDDSYIVSHKIAVWIGQNINYSLSSLTAEASLPASWVIKNKIGVCDEITNLYIAMLRSLGIPAKFVVGMSYTTSELFSENWGAHGWSEVYFPEYGWVPFDITYNQFGYVDASHIKLKEAVDSAKTGTKYEWEGKDISIKVKKLDLKVNVITSGKNINDRIVLQTKLVYPEIAYGSYNILEVKVKNTNNFYAPSQIFLSRTKDLDILDDESRQILLKPFEEKILYYKVRISESLNNNYVYNFYITSYTQLNESSSASFTALQDGAKYSFKEVDDYIRSKTKTVDSKTYTQKIQLGCIAEKQEYLLSEEKIIKCIIENKGNTVENNIYICLLEDCERINLKINEQSEKRFIVKNAKLGFNEYKITAKSSNIDLQDVININIIDLPIIRIVEKNFKDEISLSEPVAIEFTIDKDSLSVPKYIKINVDYKKLNKNWDFPQLDNKLTFKVQLQPYELSEKENPFQIKIQYKDDAGKEYLLEDAITIKLKDLTLKDNIILLTNRLLYSPEKLYALLLVLLVVVMILLIILFFRKRR
ncbi:transglutaminase domain-containing protein [Candidatus Woesearchaeota archaeon]|nr:transglutaminase domain-containing protein [Candidatus Woesearchaeota archaeon]